MIFLVVAGLLIGDEEWNETPSLRAKQMAGGQGEAIPLQRSAQRMTCTPCYGMTVS